MRAMSRSILVGVMLTLAIAYAQTVPSAPASMDRVALERRLAAVETLIERSSAARQVDTSAVPAAIERRERARAARSAAFEALRSGDLAKTAQVLAEASQHMIEAVRLAAPEQVVGEQIKAEFAIRIQSAKSLAAAQRRIAIEKSTPNAQETAHAIDRLIARAEAEAAAGSLTAARATIEQAYLLAKAAIASMRGGDTLVRSLTFASAEEEYHYEIDRNDTHRMLLNVLVEPARAAQVAAPAQQAALVRSNAEAAARLGDFRAAVRLLEQSTRELVRAIRAAGVYIPG